MKYISTKRNEILDRLNEVVKFQSHVFNKAQRITRNKISRLVDRTVFALTDTTDGSMSME